MSQQNALQTTDSALPETRFDPQSRSTTPPWLKSLLSAVGSENDKPVMMRGRKIAPEQLPWITARLSALETGLATSPEDDDARAFSIAKLQSVLGNPAIPETFAEIRVSTYLDALAEIPAWAVEEAAMRWIRGEELFKDDNPNFVPKPSQLIKLARVILKPFEKERTALKNLLEANPPPEPPKTVAAFSRPWWWMFHRFVETYADELTHEQSPKRQFLRQKVEIAQRYAIGWPVDPDRREQVERDAEVLIKLPKDSEQAARWRTHYSQQGVDMPIPDQAGWVFMPRILEPVEA